MFSLHRLLPSTTFIYIIFFFTLSIPFVVGCRSIFFDLLVYHPENSFSVAFCRVNVTIYTANIRIFRGHDVDWIKWNLYAQFVHNKQYKHHSSLHWLWLFFSSSSRVFVCVPLHLCFFDSGYAYFPFIFVDVYITSTFNPSHWCGWLFGLLLVEYSFIEH